MGLREDLSRRIDRKQQEIKELELRIREANAYIQGLQDTLKLLPKEMNGLAGPPLRAGTDLSRARAVLLKAGRPLHIADILKLMGKPTDKKTRLAVGGSIARYARKNEVFTKTAPNTFGLFELRGEVGAGVVSEPPEDFGAISMDPADADQDESS